MLDIFFSWTKNAKALLPFGVHAELTVGAVSSNSSARLDLEAPAGIGRVTCWESGDFCAEILDPDSGRDVFEQSGEFDSIEALEQQLTGFLTTLGAPAIPLCK
ncbi:hypothetical protein ACFOLJ_10510 [Rugamonas sp. CCM 8940]|uniref:immunity protein TriTu family protein n=1 Tax=Rugamonas sp. CCM 8940 TaxID=2765359 RepID=UPI0018F68DA9|nr:hypothetical protein [Rugamonas sp. CCM 8940]MBJ7309815.1 hypothetical protein [Rugamonas sp. CCM 8940]